MEDNDFKGRIDKVFGALFQLSSDTSKCWTLSGDEVEKRPWNRDESPISRENTPCGSSFAGLMGGESSNRFQGRTSSPFSREGNTDSDDDVRQESSGREGDVEDIENEERQVRLMVGMDSTLDHEDEEDEFDRVAVGREGVSERTYMRDIMAPGTRINFYNALPSSLTEVKSVERDSRANHYAAKARLKEDDDELGHVNGSFERENDNLSVQDIKPITELKSIMKCRRKQAEGKQNMEVDPPPLEDAAGGPGTCTTDSSMKKPKKRVRFDLGVKDLSGQMEEDHDMMKVAYSRNGSIVGGASSAGSIGHEHRCVPDYIQNPSKYIHYTLDWSNEDDDVINRQAFQDFSQLEKPSASERSLDLANSPGPITFIPRKKAAGSNKMRENSNHTNNSVSSEEDCSEISNHSGALPVGIAAGQAVETESPALGNDTGDSEKCDTINSKAKLQTGTRKYRSKANEDEDIDV